MEKQWIESETEIKSLDNDHLVKKNGEDRSLSTTTTSSTDDLLPKVNPVKWTVMRYLIYIIKKKMFICYVILL